MQKKLTSLVIPICLILMTASLVEADAFRLTLLAIAGFLALILGYHVISDHYGNKKPNGS